MYVVNATVTRRELDEIGESVTTIQIPTFYLCADVQGIVGIEHAKEIAAEIIDPLFAAHEISITVVEV